MGSDWYLPQQFPEELRSLLTDNLPSIGYSINQRPVKSWVRRISMYLRRSMYVPVVKHVVCVRGEVFDVTRGRRFSEHVHISNKFM